ncbi:MAG: BamA/TamA family outer membrane protein [Bacteroidales bacterium]
MIKVKYIAVLVGITLSQVYAQETHSVPDDRLVINEIIIEGNRITKENILLRELVFTAGDTIAKMDLLRDFERSRENLLNLSLFNFVIIDAEHLPWNRINVMLDVQERWYIWPTPIFEHGDRNLSAFLKEPEWRKLNYGMWLQWNNFRGRNELLNAKIRLGYREQYVIQYEKPNLGSNENHAISLSYSLMRQHRLKYTTMDNLPVYFNDEENYSLGTTDAFIAYSYRPHLYSRHRLRVHYIDDWISDTVARLNPDFFGNGYTSYRHFKIDYVYTYDIRDSKVYPLEGYAFKTKAQRFGLGIIEDYPFGNWDAEAVLFYHKKLVNRLYLANVVKGKVSSNKQVPLIQQKALGYAENLTGYDDFVLDGTDYFINKLIVKFQLVKPATFKLPYLKAGQFNKVHYAVYLNLMGDVGYVNNPNSIDPSNNMVNSLQYSTGIGIDLVTYYDKVLGIEYAVNRYGFTGFFFRVTTPFYEW